MWHSAKESTCQCRRYRRHGLDPWVRKIPWRRKWQPTSVFLPGKSHGQRSLTGYSLWGCKESDTTEWLYTHTHTHTRDDTFQVSHIVRFNKLLSESAWYLTGNISLLFLFATFLWWVFSICLWLLAFCSFIYPASTWALSTGEAWVGLEIRWWNVLGNVTALRVYRLVGDSG